MGDKTKANLADLIRQNPGAIFEVDNDCWTMLAAPSKPRDEMTDEERDAWSEQVIANDGTVADDSGGRGGRGGRGHVYGGGILQALAVIVGVKIEGV
jgi:hypothetical protein